MEPLKIFPLKIRRSLIALSILQTSRDEAALPLLFDLFEKKEVSIAFLLEAQAEDGSPNVVVVFERDPEGAFFKGLDEVKKLLRAQEVVKDDPVAVIRVLGPHFDIRPGVAALLFGNLLNAGIKVIAYATTITSTMLVVPDNQVEETVRLLQRVFQLPEGR